MGNTITLSDYLWDWLVYESTEGISDLETQEELNDYMGMEVPFTIEDVNSNWDKVQKYLDELDKELDFEVISTEITDVDLEHSWIEYEVVFKLRGNYYKTTYRNGIFLGPRDYGLHTVYQVYPKLESRIVYVE